MMKMHFSNVKMSEQALQITNVVARLQKEMKCGICCSTFKDPILSTCYHIFCRSCMNACFERKRKVQCPICRSVLDKRSCRDSYQITMAVQNYLKLSEAFKQDIENMNTFRTLPPEKAFLESQMPLDITIIPENDGKRCAPEFAIPILPVRRKRTSRPTPSDEPSTSGPPPPPSPSPPIPDFNVFAIPRLPSPVEKPPPSQKPFAIPEKRQKPVENGSEKSKKDAKTMTSPLKIGVAEMQNIDIEEQINMISQNGGKMMDEIDALFRLIPSLRPFLQKNATLLMTKFDIPRSPEAYESPRKRRRSLEKGDRRVSFANSQNLEEHRYPESSEAVKIQEKLRILEEKAPELDVLAKGDEVVDEDEVVEDSEGEDVNQEEMDEDDDDVMNQTIQPTRQPVILTAADRLDAELALPPKTIVCSRIHNDEDEVELLADFYHKFLSNACRFGDEVNGHTTHVVMMNSEHRTIPQKSTAYLQAVARKCLIVGRQWLVDCLRKGKLLSETDYTITRCTSAISADVTPNPEIGWIRSRNDVGGKLFAGCRFMILRKFTMNPYFDYKQLLELVQLCGGEILSSYDNPPPQKLFIIFSKHSKAIEESTRMEEIYKCEVVTMEWVLDSISEYSVLPTTNYKAVGFIGHEST